MLSKGEVRFRALAVLIAVAAFTLVGLVEPVQFSKWMLVRTSCGALTGLPCVFCGMTRAVHHLLNGEVARAIYYNWLSLPFVIGAAATAALLLVEVATGRRLMRLPALHLTPRAAAIGAATLLSLWSFNAYLAVSQHKSELLNPAGPLYPLFVR
jgi:hypothetical protein